MLKFEANQLNFYSQLYNKIPENHILKRINSAISLKFINDLLKDSYCNNFGRPAKEPEMMMRILILQYLYNLSDERIIEELQVNLAYMWFIGVNPDYVMPDPSLLCKFRKMRLKETSLDDIITEIVRQCIEKEIITQTNGIVIDCTHTEANTIRKVPERIMKHLARKIFKAMGKQTYEIPDYTQIEDPKEAKQVMKNYLEEVIENADESAIKEVEEAKEILKSEMFIEQKGIRSLIDKDARVGHKSETQNFFGYKTEFCQTTDGSLITAVHVSNGAYMDGKEFEKLYEMSKKSGIEINKLYGDKAYFKANILKILKEENVESYIPVSACSYKLDEELYKYNKDSDQWFCIKGNVTASKKFKKWKKTDVLEYWFCKSKCVNCELREKCLGKSKTKAKRLIIGVNAPELYEYIQRSKTEEFLKEYKKRARIEGKNGEMKRFHGLARARGYGLRSMELQSKLTAIAVNLKKISRIVASKIDRFLRKTVEKISYRIIMFYMRFFMSLFQWFRSVPKLQIARKGRYISCNLQFWDITFIAHS